MIRRSVTLLSLIWMGLLGSSQLVMSEPSSVQADPSVSEIPAEIEAYFTSLETASALFISHLVRGDVDGDQDPDILVSYSEQLGTGNAVLFYQALFLNQSGLWIHAHTQDNGSFGTSKTLIPLGIEVGKVIFETLEYSPNDGACCPSIKGKAEVVIAEGQFKTFQDLTGSVTSTSVSPAKIMTATAPKCKSTTGTYKNSRGDLATVDSEIKGVANETRVILYLKQQTFQPALSFTYLTPNGYGIRTTTTDERSIYYTQLGDWQLAVFGEGSPLWYGDLGISVPDTLWFQVSCDVDLVKAQSLLLPTLNP